MANQHLSNEANEKALQLNAKIEEEQKRIEPIYTQIGKLYYEHYSDSPVPEVAEAVAAAREAHKRIKGYNKELGLLRGVVSCPHCGKEVSVHAAFCGSCGSSMSTVLLDLAGENDIICPSCGLATPKGSAFCEKCGAKLTGSASAAPSPIDLRMLEIESEPAPVSAPAPAPAPAPKINPAPKPADAYCPDCGTKVDANDLFCPECGHRMINV